MIKFEGKILTLRSPARVKILENWNNDMQTYYPKLVVTYFNEHVEVEEYRLPEGWSRVSIEHSLEYDLDESQAYDLKQFEKEEFERYEASLPKVPKKGDRVKIVRGRKYPKGLTGTVFWVGETQWGRNVGLETINGDRIFTALYNVEVI